MQPDVALKGKSQYSMVGFNDSDYYFFTIVWCIDEHAKYVLKKSLKISKQARVSLGRNDSKIDDLPSAAAFCVKV